MEPEAIDGANESSSLLQEAERVLATAVNYLLEGSEFQAAELLASSTLRIGSDTDEYGEPFRFVELCGSRKLYDIVQDYRSNDDQKTLFRAICAAMGQSVQIRARAATVNPDANWREQALERAKGRSVDNQAQGGDSPIHYYQNLRFRSVTEIRIARELDARAITYFPGGKGRVHYNGKVANLEPDFVVIHGGKTGILEVDGDFFHQPKSAAKEHGRDRAFRSKGIVVERFTASRCYNETKAVVDEFLAVLAES